MPVAVFKKYPTEVNADGSHTIREVEFFELGNVRGFDFNEAWWEKVIQNFERDKKKGYLPTSFIGHEWSERPNLGFLDNLHLGKNGKVCLCDIVNMPDSFYQRLKAGEFPYRSAEIYAEEARIKGMAYLGSSAPHFRFPKMEVFSNIAEEAVAFSGEWFELKPEGVDPVKRGVFEGLKEFAKHLFGESAQTGENGDNPKQDLTADENKKKEGTMPTSEEIAKLQQEGRDKYISEFMAVHGCTPEEFSQKAKDQAEKEKREKIEAFQKSISDKLLTFGLKPVHREKFEALFAKQDFSIEQKQAIAEALSDVFSDKKMFADLGELGTDRGADHPDPKTPEVTVFAQKVDKRARELQKLDSKLSYHEAFLQAQNEIENEEA